MLGSLVKGCMEPTYFGHMSLVCIFPHLIGAHSAADAISLEYPIPHLIVQMYLRWVVLALIFALLIILVWNGILKFIWRVLIPSWLEAIWFTLSGHLSIEVQDEINYEFANVLFWLANEIHQQVIMSNTWWNHYYF